MLAVVMRADPGPSDIFWSLPSRAHRLTVEREILSVSIVSAMVWYSRGAEFCVFVVAVVMLPPSLARFLLLYLR